MKKIKNYLIIALLLWLLFCIITSCNGTAPQNQNSVVAFYVKDVTASSNNEAHPLDLNAQKLNRFFGLDTDPMASVTYSQSLITEVHLNKIHSVELAPADPNNFNKFKRKNAIKQFLANVDTAVKTFEDVDYGRTSSSIFIPVAKSINTLARTGAKRQLLIINSDLFENTFILSKYDPAQMQKIEELPKFLHEVLDRETPIKNRLDRMKIYIIHQPDDTTDKDFYIISNSYKSWLESKGAQVEIMASLQL